jgi:hypothetical protein
MWCRSLLVLVVVLGANGCVTRLVNRQFPPVDTTKVKLRAIETSREVLGTLPKADVYLNISASDLQAMVAPEVEAAVKGVSDLRLRLADQELIVEASFDHLFEDVGGNPNLDVQMTGTAILHATGSITGPVLQWTLLAPDSSRVRLTRVRVNGQSPGAEALAALLNPVLKAYLANIAGAIGTQTVRLDSPLIHELDPKALIKGSTITSVEGDVIEFSAHLNGGAVLLDADGVHVIGALSDTRFGGATRRHPFAVAKVDAPAIQTAFADYETAFRNVLSRHLVDDPASYWHGTSALVGKPFVAGLLNKALDSPDPLNAPKATAFLAVEDVRPEFGGLEIRAEQAPALNCQANAEKVDCNPGYTCELNKSCDPGWPCRSCEWYDVGCHGERLACEADKGRFKTMCEAEKAAHRGACEAQKVIERGACEVKKAAELAACNVNQSWLVSWQGAHFANVYGNAEFANVQARAVIHKATFSDDLSAFALMTTLHAHSDVRVTFDLRPVDAGYFACPLPFGGHVSFGLGVRPQTFNLAATVSGTATAGQGLRMQFGIPETKVTFATSQPPVAALLTQNPHFALACHPLADVSAALGLGNVVLKGRLPDQFIQDSYERTIPARTVEMDVEPLTVTIGQKPVTLTPLWLPRSFGFRK